MDRNSIIGMVIIAVLFLVYIKINAPTEAEIAEQRRLQDSIEQVQNPTPVGAATKGVEKIAAEASDEQSPLHKPIPESLDSAGLATAYGLWAQSATGIEKDYVLENDKIKVTLNNKGATIKSVELKEYNKVSLAKDHSEIIDPLLLLEDEKNQFNYTFEHKNRKINTEDLYFRSNTNSDEKLVFEAINQAGDAFTISYELSETDYSIDITLQGDILQNSVNLTWKNYLDRIEDNTDYEKLYSTIYYKEAEGGAEHCSCTGEDVETLAKTPLKWVSHVNQFFNTTLLAEDHFEGAKLEISPMDDGEEDLKLAQSNIQLAANDGLINMQMYVGPNKFENLRAFGQDVEYIIPFGSTVFGTINRWIIRPLFNFLTGIVGIKGWAIVLLTLLVKLALYPLTYKMLKSQSKMAALKPVLAKIKEKTGGDAQAQQMETMKTYREYGVNPLGGCLPMLFQMPIWFALYRFFPASITFRQADFLWARDLSSFDVIAWLPFDIPFYGDHVSLFTILWAISLIIYTYYNSQYMDYSAQPAMKYMQYFMPLMFLFYFNNFASGLSCYLLFSNIFNIAQTLITKNVIIDQDKIKAELNKNKDNPNKKKKSSFQERMEKALKEQQKLAEQRQQSKKKKS